MAEDCPFNITDNAHTIVHLKLSFVSIGIFTSIVAIICLIPLCKIRIFRIIFYAMIANGIEITLQLLELFPENSKILLHVEDDNRWDLACKTFGFLDQCTTWMGYLCLTWVSMYVIYLYKKHLMMEKELCSSYEVIGIGICYFVPFLFNWIPFVHDYYGTSGAVCWIAMVAKNQCSITEGQVYMTLLYYIPLLLFVIINVSTCVYVINIFINDPKYRERELIFVLLYPWIYAILSIVVAVSRVRSIMDLQAHKQQSFMLWKIHAVSDPLRMISLAVLVIISALCKSCRNCCGKTRVGLVPVNQGTNGNEQDEESLLHFNRN